jgi:hypothetical protein
LDYRKSKWIKPTWEAEKKEQYGYKSNMYRVEVEGEFPEADNVRLFVILIKHFALPSIFKSKAAITSFFAISKA